jgi:hypothetical protein
MENLTWEAYVANRELRRHLEHAARRERAAAIDGFLAAPLKRMVKRMFRRTGQVAVRPMHVAA